MKSNMTVNEGKKIGYDYCVNVLGKTLVKDNQDRVCFSYNNELDENNAMNCFLGISYDSENNGMIRLSSIYDNMPNNLTEEEFIAWQNEHRYDDWEYFVSCSVCNYEVTLLQSRIP